MWREYKAILSNQPFMLLWFGSLVSGFGDRFTEFALAWYMLGRTNNPLDVGLTLLAFQLPGLFTGMIAGWLLDRFRRETIMLYDNVVRGVLVALFPLLEGQNALSLPLFYIMVGVLGAFSVVTAVGTGTLISDYVEPQNYNIANSFDVVQGQLSAIVGPGLAGILIALIGSLPLLWIDSITFFVLAALLIVIIVRFPSKQARLETQKDNFVRQLVDGIGFTFRSPTLLILLSISFFWNMGLGIFNVALPFYCNEVLKVGPAGMGLLLGVNSVGVLISAVIFGPLRPRFPGRVVCVLLIVQAVCYAIMGFLTVFWAAILVYFCLGAFDDIGAIYLRTIRQRITPIPLMGRVLSFIGTVGPGGKPLGSGFSGIAVGGLGAGAVVALAGLPLFAVGALWLLVGTMRQVEDKVSTDFV